MTKFAWMTSLVGILLFTVAFFGSEVWGQTAEIKTEFGQMELQGIHSLPPQPTQSTTVINQKPEGEVPPTKETQNILEEELLKLQDLPNKVSNLESKAKDYQGDARVSNWLSWWWVTGFLAGVLWIFVWVFVGWQWARFKFWGFGWPWPWWFWVPVFWFIPWLFLAWQFWLIWWVWWIWVWWLFPWVFWLFWWIVIFKEAMIWIWKGKQP